jgi:hypothetical protein
MNWQNIKNWIAKISLYFITLVVSLFFIIFLLVQLPAVQVRISNYVLSNLHKQTGFSGKIDKFYLLWYDRLQINNLVLQDPEGNQMLKVESVYVNFSLSRLIVRKDLHLEAAFIRSGNLYLEPIAESDSVSSLNLVVFINRLSHMLASDKPKSKSKINIGEVILEDIQFTMNDTRKEAAESGLDFAHFSLEMPVIELQAVQLFNDTIQFQINDFSVFEKQSELNVKKLQSYFRFSQTGIELLNLSLSTDKSYLTDTIRLLFDSPMALADFTNSVEIEANLKNSYLHPGDLARIFSAAKNIREVIYIDGNFSGTISSFVFNDMLVKNGNSLIKGRLEMFGLPFIDDTFIELNLVDSYISAQDITPYFDKALSEKLEEIGRIDVSGQFQGFINDFVANGQLDTRYGRIISDINLKIDQQNIDLSSYSGRLNVNKFKIGELVGDTSMLQLISLNGRVKGKGLNIQSADLTLDGKISELGFKGYTYVNINTNARFFSQFFNGSISIDDPNLKLSAEAKLDLRPSINTIKVKGELNHARLHNLNLSDKYFFLSSFIDIDMQGLELDSIIGNINLKDFNIAYDENEIKLDSVFIVSEKEGAFRKLSVLSSLADVEMHGDYIYTSLFNDVSTLIYELTLQLKNDRPAIKEYYSNKTTSPEDYEVQFVFTLHDINPLIALFIDQLNISPNTIIQGEYYSGYNTMLTAYTHVDTISFTNKLFTSNTFEFNGSKISDSTSVLAMAFINSKEQNLTSKLFTRDLVLEGVWSEEKIYFLLDLYQISASNYLNITGDVQLRRDSTEIRFNPSRMQVLENIWNIESGNRVMVKGNEIKIRNLNFLNNDEVISINGSLSEDSEKALLIEFNRVSVGIINPIIGKELGGIMEGYFELKDFYHNPTMQNNILIENQTVNDFLVGNVRGYNEWNNNTKKFEINLSIDRLGKRIVNIEGSYDPFIIGDQLNLQADFAGANLNIIEPFLDFFLSRIDGTITGRYFVSGNLDLIKIQGEGAIQNGQIMVNYLKTLYKFNGNIGMEPDKINFKNLDISDINENKGRINGFIQHRNFSELSINMDGTFNNLQVLNTTNKDNELFYGIANATGTVKFLGPLNNMKISSNARTERGTRISIPLSNSTTTVDTKEYINFISFTDSTTHIELEESRKTTTELSSISLDFNIEITPDAYCEIIFDLKAGDIIRGRARGDLILQLDTKGEFNMFGPIEFTEGAYNFTLYDIVNKEFQIEPGSRITWYGDPYQGQMNIQASYNQMASIAPLLLIEDCAAPQLRRKYPIQVLLNLEGLLLSPFISFDIAAKDLPDVVSLEGCDQQSIRPDFEFQAFKSRLDDQELKRQVFSLIILRRFSQPDAFFSASGSLAGSVSELLSNQLSYWMTQVDDNLEVDIDLGSLDEEAYNTFQLRLSYRFLDGRLRISRDGSLAAQDNRSNPASLLGDLTVEYMLTTDGRFRVKMYNRTNYNSLNLNQQSTTTAGASLLYTQSFNEIKELLQSARKRRREAEISDEESEGSAKKTSNLNDTSR